MFGKVQFFSHLHAKFAKNSNINSNIFLAKNQYGYQKAGLKKILIISYKNKKTRNKMCKNKKCSKFAYF
jgi:hypothetical protein